MKKTISIITAAVLAAAALTACGTGKQADNTATEKGAAAETTAASGELKEIVVGASPAPHAEILEAIAPVLEEKGYKLVLK